MSQQPYARAAGYLFGMLAITLVGFALRFQNLDYHSLWVDEAISVNWARQTTARILEVGFSLEEDRLPPLYYLSLQGWTTLVGFSEIGIRSLSAFLGVLLIPVTAAITRHLFNRSTALIAAALIALNPFLIWYAQEARMYTPAVLFSTLSVWAFLQLFVPQSEAQRRSTGSILLYAFLFILFSILGLYNHLYAGFLLPALGLWLLIGYPRKWKYWLGFGACGLIITLLYAPILLAIWRFSSEATPGDPLGGVWGRAWWLLNAFTIWQADLSGWAELTVPIVIVLFGIAAFMGQKKPQLLILLLLVTPFIIANILLLRNHLAFFGERYFIEMTPWLLLLAAVGAYQLTRLLGKLFPINQSKQHLANQILLIVPTLILFGVTIIPLPGQWQGSATKEFWRQSVDYLAKHATDEDGILIHPDWVRYPFQFYFNGPGQTYAAFSSVNPTVSLDEPLQGVIGNHRVIWLIQAHLDGTDPDQLVEQWFANRYPLVTELYPPGISLKGYATNYQYDTLPEAAMSSDIQFNNGLKIVGYEADSLVSATDEYFHPPSGWIHVTLYWSTDVPIASDVHPYVHLVGPEGVWGINLDRPTDALKLFPPTRWLEAGTSSKIIRQDLDVNLNPATPPGWYELVVGLNDEEKHLLTTVEIE